MSGISQEAQIALAELSKRKARDRLHRDGASSIPAMQRRIQAIAAKGYPGGRNRETDAQALGTGTPWHSWSGTTSALTGCSRATCRGGSKCPGRVRAAAAAEAQ